MQGQSLRVLFTQLEQIVAAIRTNGQVCGRTLTAEMHVDLDDAEGWGMIIRVSESSAEPASETGPARGSA